MKVYLASTSVYRKNLLQQYLGLEVATVAPVFDEEDYKQKHPHLTAKQLSTQLSRGKGESIRSEALPNELIISGDQVCYSPPKTIWDKPHTVERAKQTLKSLQGSTHYLATSITIFYQNKVWEHQDVTALTMHSLSDEEITKYIEDVSPLDCAGSYKIEDRGLWLFSQIETEDFTSIQGIPLLYLANFLRTHFRKLS